MVDLRWQHEEIAGEIMPEMQRIMAEGSFIGGADVSAFEAEFSAFCGVAHCVGVANGTDALELALRAAGIGGGEEVILPANTFVATAEAIVRAGARPVIVDCDEDALIDVDRVAERLGRRVRAVTPVHLYGQIADMEALVDVVAARPVAIIEDAAQAQGATRTGRGIGAWSVAAATSFYPGKNLGAYGDAGAVLTNDAAVERIVRRLANHGSEAKYVHRDVGCNSRLDSIQAVVLRAKLRRLCAWNRRREEAAVRYEELLAPLAQDGLVRLPAVLPGNRHVWHLYVVRVADRDAVIERLAALGVNAGVHYPLPIHLQAAFRSSGYVAGDFPVAERICSEIVSLPIYPGITASQQEQVAFALDRALSRRPLQVGR